mgnify:CR=1 FL=1
MNKVWFSVLLILIIAILGALYVSSLLALEQAKATPMLEPMIIEKTVYPEPRIEYQDRIVEKLIEKEVMKTVEVTKEPRWFNSVEALREWRNKRQVIFFDGSDCDDYAEWLMLEALQDGYLLPVVPIWNSAIFGEWVGNFGKEHVGNWTWIENDFYYIEPTPGGKIVKLEETRRD